MNYEYWIFKPNSREEVGAVIPTTEPMNHIEVGHLFYLEYRDGHSIVDLDLKIENIEVSLFASTDEAGLVQPQKMVVHIYTQKWNKNEQQ